MFEVVRHQTESDTGFMIETMEAIMSSQSGPIDPLKTSVEYIKRANLYRILIPPQLIFCSHVV